MSAGLQWTIGDFIAFAPAVREAALTFAAAQADANAAENAEKVKVIGLYFDALKTRAVADARRSALALAGTQHDAAVPCGPRPVTRRQLDVDAQRCGSSRKPKPTSESAVAADQNATEALAPVETNAAARLTRNDGGRHNRRRIGTGVARSAGRPSPWPRVPCGRRSPQRNLTGPGRASRRSPRRRQRDFPRSRSAVATWWERIRAYRSMRRRSTQT